MKTTIIRIIQMLVLSAAFYLGIMFVINKVIFKNRRIICYTMPYVQRAGGQERLMGNDFDPSKKYDVLVYGSSHAYRGYDPRNFEKIGLSLFNAGTSSQSISGTLVLAKNAIPPSSGKLVILDIYDVVWGISDLENSNLLIQNFPNTKVKTAAFTSHPDIRKFNQLVASWCSSADLQETKAKGYIANGYCTRTDTVSLPWPAVDVISEIDPRYLEDFETLIHEIKASGSTLVLVSHPLPPIQKLAENHRLLLPFINEATKKHQLQYFDYTHHLDFQNSENFADENHLNQSGVDRFNEMLIADLKKHQLLPQ